MQYHQLTVSEQQMIELLKNLEDPMGTHKINKIKYNLKIAGRTMCPASFAAAYGLAPNTLRKLTSNMDPVSDDDSAQQLNKVNKKQL